MKPEVRQAAAFIDRLDPTTRSYVIGMVYRVAGSGIARIGGDPDPYLSVVGASSQDEPEGAAPEAEPPGTVIPFPEPRQ